MPVRVVHHSMVVRALNSRATASWGRMRSAFKPPPPARFPIPLLLPCEILLIVAEMLPPEACACLVNCCSYMRGLYCEDGTFATEQLWGALLRRTFPQRYTGAPGPNAPPRLRGSARLALGAAGAASGASATGSDDAAADGAAAADVDAADGAAVEWAAALAVDAAMVAMRGPARTSCSRVAAEVRGELADEDGSLKKG